MIISKESRSAYCVYVARDASDSTVYAGEQLCLYLRKATGALLPLMRVKPPVDKFFAVGSGAARECGVDVDAHELGQEGYLLRAVNGCVVISGASDTLRGDVYGVFDFLEKYVGARFFTETIERIPSRPTLCLPDDIDERVVPALEYRDVYYPGLTLGGDWSVKNRANGQYVTLRAHQGGKVSYYPFVHSFNLILDPEEYFDEHPEYFSYVDGKRVRERTQLCLTNPDVLRIAKQRVREWIQAHPEASIVSISQNDCFNPCQCEHCREVDEYEGSHAGTLLRFVNAIAGELAEEFPNIVFDTLAYQYTRKPPLHVRPLPNVCVRLCSIECCFAHPLGECHEQMSRWVKEKSAAFQDDLEGWAKICDRLYVWDYVVNYTHYMMPFFNFNVLAPNIRYLIDNHVKGIFEEGSTSLYGGTELAEMRAWILSKLLWNPSLDTHELAREFIAGVYGQAAPYIQRYYDLLRGALDSSPDSHFGLYDLPKTPYITPAVIAKAMELFDMAESAADDEIVRERVRMARLPMRYFELYTQPLDTPGRDAAIDEFHEELKSRCIWDIMEGRTLDYAIEDMRKGPIDRFSI